MRRIPNQRKWDWRDLIASSGFNQLEKLPIYALIGFDWMNALVEGYM
jgi:hypothetical protein